MLQKQMGIFNIRNKLFQANENKHAKRGKLQDTHTGFT